MTPVAALVGAVAARLPVDVPVDLDRDEAQRLARIELAKPVYSQDEEPWVQRVVRWLIERVSELLDRAAGTSPLGWLGLLGVALLVVLVVVAVRRRTGPLRRATQRGLFTADEARSAHDLRREAERLAGQGAWAEALRARLRAVVRDLEERGVVEAPPGRTADEIAGDAGRALPTVAADLRAGARLFDDVWYGGRTADARTYEQLVAVDDAVSAARPGPAAPAAPGLAVPR